MDKSVLFFDIDGTLLSEITGKIPDSAVRAVELAKKAGHVLLINTGRTICSIPAEIRKLPFDGYLCGCGTYLLYHNEVLLENSLSMERGREILRMACDCRLGVIAEGPEDVYFPERISRFDRLESTRRYFRQRGMGMESTIENADFIYDKVFIYEDGQSDLERFMSFIEKDMEAIDRGKNAYEVIQKGFSKATACACMLEKLGIPKERAYVFGDSSNDLAMFEFGAHTIAMGKHAEVLDPLTDFVTKTVEEDGIAWAMEHYGLLK